MKNTLSLKEKNLSRYKTKSTSVNGSYYLPHIVVSVNEIINKEKKIEILKSTENVYAWYNSLINELETNQEFIEGLANSITRDCSTETEKIATVFKWVQNNIQYVAFENGIAGFKPTEAHDVANSKYGDCKGMANLLVQLLKSQGFDARYAWIGTRNRNYSYKLPSLVVDNHMICALNFNNQTYFLDGTSKSALWNEAPAHLEGKEVLVSNTDSYSIQKIKKSIPNENSIEIEGFIDLNKSKPNIELNITLTGHFKKDFTSINEYAPLTSKKNTPYYFLYDYLDGIKVKEISNPTISNRSITYKVSGNYTDIAINESDKIIFPFLNIFTYGTIDKDNPPIYVEYPQKINTRLEIINANKLPKEIYPKAKIGNNNFSALFSSEKVGNKYYINQQLNLNILHSSLNDNELWNDFANKVKAYSNYHLTYE